MLRKALAAGTVVLMLAGANFALARNADRGERGFRPSAEDHAAFTDARVAALKAGLQLTPEQEKNWPPVEAAVRELDKQRADRMKERADRRAERREQRENNADQPRPRANIVERLRHNADAMSTRGAALKKLADASEPLYNSLDDAQKRRFAVLLRMSRGAGPHHHRHHHWQRRADNDRLDSPSDNR